MKCFYLLLRNCDLQLCWGRGDLLSYEIQRFGGFALESKEHQIISGVDTMPKITGSSFSAMLMQSGLENLCLHIVINKSTNCFH